MGARMAQSPFQGQEEEQSATLERWAGVWTPEFSAGERGSQRCRPQGAAIAGFLLVFIYRNLDFKQYPSPEGMNIWVSHINLSQIESSA